MNEQRECSECNKVHDAGEFSWTYDRYGIVYRKVCSGCWETVQASIQGYTFDPDDAGESLEPEDY